MELYKINLNNFCDVYINHKTLPKIEKYFDRWERKMNKLISKISETIYNEEFDKIIYDNPPKIRSPYGDIRCVFYLDTLELIVSAKNIAHDNRIHITCNVYTVDVIDSRDINYDDPEQYRYCIESKKDIKKLVLLCSRNLESKLNDIYIKRRDNMRYIKKHETIKRMKNY